MGGIVIKSQLKQLQELYLSLTEHLSQLICVYDDLILQQGPRLEARYLQEFGSLDREAYQAYAKGALLRRRSELVKKSLQRKEKPDFKAIEQVLAKESRVYERELKRLDDKNEWAAAFLADGQPSVAAAKKMKKMYCQLVRKLHPEIAAGQTETVRGLWRQARSAYADGDADRLELIVKLAADIKTAGDDLAADAAKMKQKCESVKARAEWYLNRIGRLEEGYPFNFKDILRNPEEVAAHKEDLRRQAATYRAQIEKLQSYYNLLSVPRDKVLH